MIFDKKHKIVTRNYLTNIFSKNEQSQKRYSFVRVYNEDEEYYYVYNIMRNNKEEKILKNTVVGKLYNPKVYKTLYKLLSEYYANYKSLNLHLKHKQTATITLNDESSQVITFSQIKLVNGSIYFIDDNGNNSIEIHKIKNFNNGSIIINQYIHLFNYLLFQDYSYDNELITSESKKWVTDSEKLIWFSFYKELDFYLNYENCVAASRFYFINLNKLSERQKASLKNSYHIVNLINIHIEFFVVLKYFAQFIIQKSPNLESYIVGLMYHFLQTITPSLPINYEHFVKSIDLLPVKYVFNGKVDGYLNSYNIELVINNIKSKYNHEIINMLVKVINNMSSKSQEVQQIPEMAVMFSEFNRIFSKQENIL